MGQRVVLTGESTDLNGVTQSESLTVSKAELADGYSWLTFEQGPQNRYVRNTVTFCANVSLSTHGETVEEVVGSGDATRANQSFTLRQPPLTHVSDDNPTGSLSTLEIRVNGLLWREVPSFFRAGPDDQVYITRNTEQDTTIVQFGDGLHGARVPTGQENITARYRKGMGVDGLLETGQLSLLQSRPLGLRSVTNSIPSAGMADRETVAEARTNVPLVATTLGRVVSLRDYQDFAGAFPGVAKADAIESWSKFGKTIFVTVAGPDGAEIADGSDLRSNLLSAIRKAGDPSIPLMVKSYTPAFFTLTGVVRCHSESLQADVDARVRAALRQTFGFASRSFRQSVAYSEVVAAIHSVAGVAAVDLDSFHRVGFPVTLADRLSADGPRRSAETDLGAELLVLDARPIQLTTVKAAS